MAVHAKGKTIAEVTRAIAGKCEVDTDDPRQLAERLRERHASFTIVVDALDEAREADKIAHSVLRHLTKIPCVRLLIGTRPEPIPALGPHVLVKDLGEAAYHDVGDLEEYVVLRLLAEDEPEVKTPYRNQPALAREVAGVVAAKADPVFLIARLISEELLRSSETVNPEDLQWGERLPTNVEDAFRDYLDRFGNEAEMVRDLLLPLAYSEGEGFPWEDLWAPVASALSGGTIPTATWRGC